MANSTVAGVVAKSGDDGRLPILIGISGQRFFDKNSLEANLRVSEEMAQALTRLFEKLDEELPNTPKILVTGGALGTDLLAVAAARRLNWQVVLLLAFDSQLFLEDFEPPETVLGSPDEDAWRTHCKEAAQHFRDLVGSEHPDVIVKTLPTLAGLEGPSATDAGLSKESGSAVALRDEHYEQVGQWLAEAATVLVAVTSEASKPSADANGGTARVVATRRSGRPIDEAGLAVARRSSVLRHQFSPALPPPAKPALLIDPRNMAAGDDRYGVRLLAPELDIEPIAAHTGRTPEPSAHPTLALARGFERLNRRLGTRQSWSRNPFDAIEQMKSVLDPFTGRAKGRSHAAFRSLALLFVIAVFVFEVYAKFFPSNWIALGVYLIVLSAIGVVALAGRLRRWQPISEDYRVVAEMLRVQRAWWALGLPNRVDREHLQGVDSDLARSRDAATTILSWIWLRELTPAAEDWGSVREGGPKPRRLDELLYAAEPKDWIGDQIRYLVRTQRAREESAHRSERMSWFLFITGSLLAVLLCAWLEPWQVVEHAFQEVTSRLGRATTPLAIAALAAIVWMRNLAAPYRRGLRGFLLSLGFAAPAAISLMLAALGIGELVALFIKPELCDCARSGGEAPSVAHDVGKAAATILIVVLNAIAGAWRFLAEKLGWEAEALAFRDAAASYMTAEAALAADWGPDGKPRNPDKARAIVLSLGHLALRENEAWLKMRRERPLTPVSG